MKKFLPKILRFFVCKFIVYKPFYLPSMVLVRLSRKLRYQYFNSNEEKSLVNNSMGNIKMEVDKNSYMGGSIYWSGYHHINEILYLNKFLKNEYVNNHFQTKSNKFNF